jgi:hypothetical protein
MRTLILVSALFLGGCVQGGNSLHLPTNPIVEVCSASEKTLIDEKALYSAELLYNIPAHAYTSANYSNLLTPELKAILKPKLVTLYQMLKAVRSAKGSLSCDLNAMQQLHNQIIPLLPKR